MVLQNANAKTHLGNQLRQIQDQMTPLPNPEEILLFSRLAVDSDTATKKVRKPVV